ncbi:MAG: hypothetical protein IH626_12945 [Rhodospirillales bacterium]|nr:hypothetical protein [Rhodospirillales bacterium]
MTWRQLDGAAFKDVAGGPDRFLNGGTALLQIHQTRVTAGFYLDHFPNVETLLVMIGLPDFVDCTVDPAFLFEPEDAARYTFGDWPSAYFYLRYVSPQRYLRGVMNLPKQRTPFTGDLYLDTFGSGPLHVPEHLMRGLRYGKPKTDAACVAALGQFLDDTQARGVALLLVFAPVHPDYRAEYPDDTAWLAGIADHAETKADQGEELMVLDMIDDPAFVGRDFFDAFHLQWPAVKTLSAHIAGSLQARPPVM